MLSLACLSAASIAAADDASPRVIGFERFYSQKTSDLVAAGQLLLGELNCTSCHKADVSLAGHIRPKAAPVLDTVATRIRPEYLLEFLADPQAAKPGTTMPSVLVHLPQSERRPIVEALVHFLATTGTLTHSNPVRQAVDRGEKLFHSIGCVACHDPRLPSDHAPLPTSIPLGTLSRKYTLPGLTEFLANPLAVRPSGRMPHLNLTPAEARDIASYLLNDLDIVSGLQYAYYEGSWEKLPDFQQLTPIAVGDANALDLSPARSRDHFALRFEGAIQIPQEGDYLFLVGSDDGARLLIDDKLVINNDGVHAYEQKRKKVKMTAGLHTLTIEYFEQEGEETLQVDFEGPGMTQQPLATLLTAPVTMKGTAPPPKHFAIDTSKAAKGKEYFASLGCASCHTLRRAGGASTRAGDVSPPLITDEPITPTNTAPALLELAPSGGCLDAHASQSPRYALSPRQREALVAAINAAKRPAKDLNASEFVSRSMIRFNCYACHERDKFGGVEEPRNSWFQTDTPEMGDEGRIPPHLTGVAAKLNPAWLRALFDKGAKDRPYMFTRMPSFGIQNVAGLVSALEQADAPLVRSDPLVHIAAEDEKKFKAAGRRLIGSQGFSCIKCHTFADKRSTGIQAASLTSMTTRLRRDWFYYYLLNPAAYRPGTRMPTAFPDGQTTLPMVLDGTAATQIAAIWNYLSDGERAMIPAGLVTGKMELIAFDEAVIYRNFIEGAGTRAIGVGYPEKLNLAFDADQMRIALMWHGPFIDAARHWSARGAGFERPLGDKVLRLPDGPPLAALSTTEGERGASTGERGASARRGLRAWPEESPRERGWRFRGYRLGHQRQPTFLYSWNGLTIEDQPFPVGADDVFSFHRKLKITAELPHSGLWFRAARSPKISRIMEGTFEIDQRWILKVTAAGRPELREQGDEWELLVPIEFQGNEAKIELTYDW